MDMRKFQFVFIMMLASVYVQSQSASSYTVQLEAEANANGPSITLTWNFDGAALNYSVFRKTVSSASWGTAIANLTTSDTTYTDATVTEGLEYEYRVTKSASSYVGYGYTHSGIKANLNLNRGDLLLLVESSIYSNLTDEVNVLMNDLLGDGWRVKQLTVQADSSVAYIKSLVTDAYTELPQLNMVYVLGHVPVPYSGELYPDGHTNHVGAWPADVFYAEVNNTWTDASVNNSTSADSRNHNIPGDGKLDQSSIPGDVELMVGRVDFYDLPAFSEGEIELTRRYLNRTHEFKMGEIDLQKRALIDDNFGGFSGEAFAANGWRNFAPLVGRSNVSSLDYRSTMNIDSYLFSYGCGGGSFTSASGIGTSVDLANDSLLTGFTMLFGSYFGDWGKSNNFMRSALAQGTTMTISWAGRPHWHYQSMGLGYPVGYAARLTQNNSGTYVYSYGARFVHIALLGDPSLRMEYVKPISNLTIDTIDTFHVNIQWSASIDSNVLGYQIYQRVDDSPWFKRNDQPVVGTQFIDSCVLQKGHYEYMVRAVSLVENFSGSYFNESIGVAGEIVISSTKFPAGEALFKETAGTNPVEGVFVAQPSKWTTLVQWEVEGNTLVGDSIAYTTALSPGQSLVYNYEFSNSCEATDDLKSLTLNINDLKSSSSDIMVYPNPATSRSEVHVETEMVLDMVIVSDIQGRSIGSFKPKGNSFGLPQTPAGVYLLDCRHEGQSYFVKLIIE